MAEPTSSGGLTVEATLALVVERLGDLKVQQEKDTAALTNAIAELRQEMQSNSRTYVPRAEWMLRNTQVDERHVIHGKEIGQLKVEFASDLSAFKASTHAEINSIRDGIDQTERSRRMPGISVAAVIISGLAALFTALNLPLGLG